VLANKLLFFLLCFYFFLVKPNKYGRIRLQLNPKPKFEKRKKKKKKKKNPTRTVSDNEDL